MEFAETRDWVWILLLFGILPFLIAQYFATVTVQGAHRPSGREAACPMNGCGCRS
jgi:hypothetical protein